MLSRLEFTGLWIVILVYWAIYGGLFYHAYGNAAPGWMAPVGVTGCSIIGLLYIGILHLLRRR